jgi:hypothetical protein
MKCSPTASVITTTCAALYILLVVSATYATAQTVDDYKKASEQKGCGVIPYQSVWKDCDDAEKVKAEACGKKFSCGQDLDRKDKDEIKTRIENGEACQKAREGVSRIFERARDTLRNESEEAKRKYATVSAEKIEQGRDGHAKAIEDAKSAVFNCKALYNP